MKRPTHTGIRHLALNVRDLEAMKRFYTDLLGFSVEWEPDGDNVYLSSGIDNLALHRSTRPQPGARQSPAVPAGGPTAKSTLDHLGLIVREADDVDRWAAFLESRGVTIDAQPRTHRDGARSCYFSDPDGNSVQILHHPPISGR
jgi:catechol 2,3-dioxygenase-like lactoylglutathione lyase family enzyme